MTSPTSPPGPRTDAGSRSPALAEADMVAAAVLACPGVVGLHGGTGVRQVATYLPGRRVTGVRVDETGVQVSVVAAAGVRLPYVAAQVRSSLTALAGGRPVDVHIADVALPGEAVRPAVGQAAPPVTPTVT